MKGDARKRLRTMNLLDWILIILIGISTVYGLFKGLVMEVISLLALIIGLVGASRLYDGASLLFKNLGIGEQVAKILSFAILFIIIFIALVLIGKLLHKFIHAIFLGWLNRLGGIGFGFLRGIIVSGIIILILAITLSEKAPILTESKLTPHVMDISKVLLSLVPEDLQRRFMEQEKKLREFWKGSSKPERLTFKAEKVAKI
jgi:membrane protein required for colicin V production